jgi:hypothetical protein
MVGGLNQLYSRLEEHGFAAAAAEDTHRAGGGRGVGDTGYRP